MASHMMIAYLTLMVLGFIGLGVYKYRYTLWSGYFKASFIGSDGRTFDRIFRIKHSDMEFITKYRGEFHTHGLDKEVIYRSVKWRLPHAYYHCGVYAPIDMNKLKFNNVVASARYNELASNSVTKDLFTAFNPTILSTTSAVMIGTTVVIIGLLILGYFINEKFTEVLAVIT